jgi:hypothetical protein
MKLCLRSREKLPEFEQDNFSFLDTTSTPQLYHPA